MVWNLKNKGESAYWRSLRFWYPPVANDNYRG